MKNRICSNALLMAAVAVTVSACGTMSSPMSTMTMQAPQTPANVSVPSGHKVAMMLTGEGMLTYECRANAAGAAAPFGWSPPAPDAVLKQKSGTIVGKYYPGPTWEHNDGSKVTGKQLAVAPTPTGIALQLVQAETMQGSGAMHNITYIQRVNTVGGTAAGTCDATNVGAKQVVKYAADYYFYKPA